MAKIFDGCIVCHKGNDTYMVDGMHQPFVYVHFKNGEMVYPIISLTRAEQLEKLNSKKYLI